jgi:recombination associated protein RdgC
MWFRNLRLYRLDPAWDMDATRLNDLLAARPLARCGSFDMHSRGWVYPKQDGEFVRAVDRRWLLALGVEQKLLPTTVIRQVTQERAAAIEAEQDRKVGRKELRDLRDRVTEELLPKAFTSRRTTWGYLDPAHGWLAIDAGSDARADEFIEALVDAVSDLPLRPLQTQISPTSAMTGWLAEGDAPAAFSIDQDLELRAAAGQATVRYARHALEGEEIRRHIADGKVATKLGMTWNDRVSFVLTEKLQLKRLAFLDVLREQAGQSAQDADEQFDADFALMAGELAKLLADLVIALGGEEQRA